jgi:hypothetical protein
MKEQLINCPNCTYICDLNKESACLSCGSSLLESSEEYVTDLGEVLDGVNRATHAIRSVGLFLILSALNSFVMAFTFFLSGLSQSSTPFSAALIAAGVGIFGFIITLMTAGRELSRSKP